MFIKAIRSNETTDFNKYFQSLLIKTIATWFDGKDK